MGEPKTIYVYFSQPSGPEMGMYLSILRTKGTFFYTVTTAAELDALATERNADFVVWGTSGFPRRPTPIEFARPMFVNYVRILNAHR
jgi:hypothetical protein